MFGLLVAQAVVVALILPLNNIHEDQLKIYFVSFISILILLLSSLNFFLSGQFRFLLNPLLLPLVLIGFWSLLSNGLSMNFYNGFFGAGDRFANTTLLYLSIIFTFIFSTSYLPASYNRKLLSAYMVSIALAALLQILSTYDISPLYKVTPNIFSSGFTNYLAIIEVVLYPLIVMSVISSNSTPIFNFGKAISLSIALKILILLMYAISLASINYFPTTIALTLSIITIVLYRKNLAFKSGQLLAAISMLILVLVLTVLLPLLPIKKIEGKEIFLPYSTSAQITFRSLFNTPYSIVTGNGNGSFGYLYNKYKPADLNATSIWNARFTKSGSEVMDVIVSSGTVGLILFGWLFYELIKLVNLTVQQNLKDKTVLVAGFSILLAFLMMILTNVSVGFFVLLGILLSLLISELKTQASIFRLAKVSIYNNNSANLLSSLSSLLMILIPVFSLYSIYTLVMFISADIATLQASFLQKKGNLALSYQLSHKAAELNPYRDIYHVNLSKSSFLYSDLLITNLSPDNIKDTNKITDLLKISITEAASAAGYNLNTKGTDKYNVSNWEYLATLYSLMGKRIDNSTNHALNALFEAEKLDPSNPLVKFNLATIYMNSGKASETLTYLDKAILLKPDLAILYVKKSEVYETINDLPKAVENYKTALKYTDLGTNDYTHIKTKVDNISSQKY